MSNTVNNYTETEKLLQEFEPHLNCLFSGKGEYNFPENMMTQLRMNILIQFHMGAAHISAWQNWRQRSPELLLMRDAIQNIGR